MSYTLEDIYNDYCTTNENIDKTIFKDKTLSDLFSEIYDNSTSTRSQIKGLISELKPLIQDIGDATLVVPLLKEYLEISVKNDEQLIKMATIIQRAVQNEGDDDGNFGMTEEEKQQLLNEVKKYGEDKKK